MVKLRSVKIAIIFTISTLVAVCFSLLMIPVVTQTQQDSAPANAADVGTTFNFADGNGTENNPYIIQTELHFREMDNYYRKYNLASININVNIDVFFKLDNDLELENFYPIGYKDVKNKKSSVCSYGTFDGGYHTITIKNDFVKRDNSDPKYDEKRNAEIDALIKDEYFSAWGLFSYAQDFTIKNLRLEGYLEMKAHRIPCEVGSLIGAAYTANSINYNDFSPVKIENCYVDFNISCYDTDTNYGYDPLSRCVGGLIGAEYCSYYPPELSDPSIEITKTLYNGKLSNKGNASAKDYETQPLIGISTARFNRRLISNCYVRAVINEKDYQSMDMDKSTVTTNFQDKNLGKYVWYQHYLYNKEIPMQIGFIKYYEVKKIIGEREGEDGGAEHGIIDLSCYIPYVTGEYDNLSNSISNLEIFYKENAGVWFVRFRWAADVNGWFDEVDFEYAITEIMRENTYYEIKNVYSKLFAKEESTHNCLGQVSINILLTPKELTTTIYPNYPAGVVGDSGEQIVKYYISDSINLYDSKYKNKFSLSGYKLLGFNTNKYATEPIAEIHKKASDEHPLAAEYYCIWGLADNTKREIVVYQNYEGADPEYESKIFDVNEKVNLLTEFALEREGYTLLGFSTKSTSDEYITELTISKDASKYVLYAVWIEGDGLPEDVEDPSVYQTIKVYRNTNVSDINYEEKQVKALKYVDLIDLFSYDNTPISGYLFLGYSTRQNDKGLKYAIQIIPDVKRDYELYAQWEEFNFYIKAYQNYNSSDTNYVEITYGAAQTVNLMDDFPFVREGYKLIGFRIGSRTSGEIVTQLQIRTKLHEIYAQWEEIEPYSITVYRNFSADDTVSETISYNDQDDSFALSSKATLDDLDRSAENYSFVGFATTADGKAESVVIEKGTTGNKEYFCIWEEIVVETVVVTFKSVYYNKEIYSYGSGSAYGWITPNSNATTLELEIVKNSIINETIKENGALLEYSIIEPNGTEHLVYYSFKECLHNYSTTTLLEYAHFDYAFNSLIVSENTEITPKLFDTIVQVGVVVPTEFDPYFKIKYNDKYQKNNFVVETILGQQIYCNYGTNMVGTILMCIPNTSSSSEMINFIYDSSKVEFEIEIWYRINELSSFSHFFKDKLNTEEYFLPRSPDRFYTLEFHCEWIIPDPTINLTFKYNIDHAEMYITDLTQSEPAEVLQTADYTITLDLGVEITTETDIANNRYSYIIGDIKITYVVTEKKYWLKKYNLPGEDWFTSRNEPTCEVNQLHGTDLTIVPIITLKSYDVEIA